MTSENLFVMNRSDQDPNVRGAVPPLVWELHEDVVMGAMVAGIKSKTVQSKLGKGKGALIGDGIIPLLTKGKGDNEVLAFKASEGSGAGEVDVLMHSSDATATDNFTLSFWLVGTILPFDV